jgi:hypothetical protein
MIVVPWNPALLKYLIKVILNIQHASKRWTENIRWRGEILTNVPANLNEHNE